MSACVCLSCEAARQSERLPAWWQWTTHLGVGIAMRNPVEYAAWFKAMLFGNNAPDPGGPQ